MKSEDFIEGIRQKRDYFASGVIENLISPPGRKPHQKDINLSEFYNSLSDAQKQKVNDIIYESTDSAIFHLLCILDNVSFLEDTNEKTRFELYSVKGEERILINDSSKKDLETVFQLSI